MRLNDGGKTNRSQRKRCREIATSLREALAELSPAYRECLVLFYLEGKSGSEAAHSLGLSESAFRVRLLRARRALRRQLDNKLAGALHDLRPPEVRGFRGDVRHLRGLKRQGRRKRGATGAAGAGLLVKMLPLKWFFPLFSVLYVSPAAALSM